MPKHLEKIVVDSQLSKQIRYQSIDGFRALFALGILAMHVAANGSFVIKGVVFNALIPEFKQFVFPFMTVSAFGMCCGYYQKIMTGNISLPVFYKRRYAKVLPFFAILVLIDIVVSPSTNSLQQAFLDLTLMHGFLPNPQVITVIGVGWFIGLVFVFYLVFPFFCCLVETKKKAWIALLVAIVLNIVSTKYDAVRSNFIYSACFFIAGGLVWRYKNDIAGVPKWCVSIYCLLSILVLIPMRDYVLSWLPASTAVLVISISGIGAKFFGSKLLTSLGAISMEIYLSHMLSFRVVERLGLNSVTGQGWPAYLLSVVLTLVGAVVFSVFITHIISSVKYYISLKKRS